MCYIAVILYYLFELQETVVVGLPSMLMAQDKWTEDFLPAIQANRFSELLPTSGEGSRGGQVKRAIQFKNGVALRFMAAGGSDKQKAGYTTRIVAITETDGMDTPGETSREADPIEQIEGRTLAYGEAKRIYLECTASIETGRIWQEITNGTNSRIARPCPYCGEYVTPEREHLVGWHEAESELEAAEKGHWICPSCSHAWTDDDRRKSSFAGVLVHRGQKVLPNGEVIGELPPTRTLGFRWSAVDNPFATTASLAAGEWKAEREADRENAEKKRRQFIWCLPWIPPEIEISPLTVEAVSSRSGGLKKGRVPEDCIGIAGGIDTGKKQLHWHVLAMRKNGSAHIIDYGIQPTEADRLGMEKGLLDALYQLHCYFLAGWEDQGGRKWIPSQVWIDSGYADHQRAVYAFCKGAAVNQQPGQEVYRPAKGFGEKQYKIGRYRAPKKRQDGVRYIGLQFDMRMQPADQIILVNVNADFWKSALHDRLAMSVDEPGALTLFEVASAREHLEYSEQITAEVQNLEFIDGRGEVIVWKRIRRQNHYLDAGYLSLAAGQFIAAEIERQAAQPAEGWMERQRKQRRSTWTNQ